MDMGDKDKFELENRNGDLMNYAASMSDWRFGTANLTSRSLGLVPTGNLMAVSKGDLIGSSSCSSTSMVESFGQTLWGHNSNSENLGFYDINGPKNASTSERMGKTKADPVSLISIERSSDMGWNQTSPTLKGGIFLPNAAAMPPQSLSQFPADSGFIERAARFSCFNGGNFNDMGNPFAIPEPMGLYSRGGRLMQGTQEAFTDDGLESLGGGQPQKNEHSVGDASKDVPLSFDHGDTERSQSKNGRKHESLLRSHDEAKRGIGPSGNDSDEAEFSGARGQDVPSMLEGSDGDAFAKGLDSRKRKRSGQDTKLDLADGASQQSGESVKDDAEIRGKGDHNPTPTTSKNFGKHGKQGSQASDQAKEEYIHVRARRGQATNSHSLAERVRREKISERMKFLQDLVPGCSKVTGKAVMLDEIINYVQSLQRQVEFLSMKLATVNPRLDLNIEGLLAKNIFQTRAGSSSALGFSPDMSAACPLLLPSHERFIQAGLPGMGNSSDLLRRGNDTQLTPMSGGFKEPAQLANVWEDELHNAVRSRYGSSAALHSEGSLATGHLKSEP